MEKFYLTLDNEFLKYCELNNIDNIEKFAIDTFRSGFNLVKYGNTPTGTINEKIIEKETVKEIVMIPCVYCGSLNPQTELFCSTCGAQRKA